MFVLTILSPPCLRLQQRLWDWFQRYFSWVLKGLAVIYGMIVKIRRMAYQREWLRQHHLPQPVVSIGNLTVGGTGKTPLTIWVAQQLHARGKRVAVLSRGYGRQDASENLLVSDGQGHIKAWPISGDEPTMIAHRCPWAVVAVGPDRYRLGQWVLEQTSCDYFLLDDGFQHLPLHRDVDVLLFDTTDSRGLSGVLPAGRLREPLEASKDAEAIVFTRAYSSSSPSIQSQLEKAVGQSISPMFVKLVPQCVQHVVTRHMEPLTYLLDTSLLVVSGIGNPRSFRELLTSCGVGRCTEIQFPDHYAYGQGEIDSIRKALDQSEKTMVMTTEKDAVKLRSWFTKDDPVWCLLVDIEFVAGENDFLQLLDNIDSSV